MISGFIANYVFREKTSLYEVAFAVMGQHLYDLALIIDNEDKLVGIITKCDISRLRESNNITNDVCAGDVCRRNFKYLKHEEDIYLSARNLFAEYYPISSIPIVNASGEPIDIITYWQAFYKQHYHNKISALKLSTDGLWHWHKYHYARCIWRSAETAAALGYKKMSVIEFGVAGGNGLLMAELHSKEIARIFNIDIEVYGFDNGTGLPKSQDYRDIPYVWSEGFFKMDTDKLQKRLKLSKLVMGDIKDTSESFFKEYSPAPVGAMFIDVDYYNSTVPILKMLHEDDKYFLPRLNLFFDDISPDREYLGELLAIKEFNNASENVKISPEYCKEKVYLWGDRGSTATINDACTCHRFKHPLYTESSRTISPPSLSLQL